MISPALLARVACPLCLEAEGCAECRRGTPHAESCGRDYASRVRCACGGPDKVGLQLATGADGTEELRCPCCAARYPVRRDEGHADLRPAAVLGDGTL